jgi:hypothetical protein
MVHNTISLEHFSQTKLQTNVQATVQSTRTRPTLTVCTRSTRWKRVAVRHRAGPPTTRRPVAISPTSTPSCAPWKCSRDAVSTSRPKSRHPMIPISRSNGSSTGNRCRLVSTFNLFISFCSYQLTSALKLFQLLQCFTFCFIAVGFYIFLLCRKSMQMSRKN